MYAWSFIKDSLQYNGWFETEKECLQNAKERNYTNYKWVFIGKRIGKSSTYGMKYTAMEEIKEYNIKTGEFLAYVE